MTKGFGGMNQIMKQAQAMQKQMLKIQEELAQKEVTGSAGGNMVTATINGKQEVLAIQIDPSVMKEGDREMLQDLITAAVNDGLNRSREMMTQAMGAVTGGLNMPGLF